MTWRMPPGVQRKGRNKTNGMLTPLQYGDVWRAFTETRKRGMRHSAETFRTTAN